ncbi:wax ester/triacylglycerol synthase domain-containing protein [Nocardia sp. NPDC052566]|uniref:wax ester/triacylglycerol synthase domain-containing protein n=1 Tax=Nocardia sp. NPDC052566 TaxID=3364330 RepID=UPI0037C8CE38
MRTVAPQDATIYWLSGRTRNDLFLLYCFTDTGLPTVRLRQFVAERSAAIPDLRVRLRAVPGDLGYPSWVRCESAPGQFVEHRLAQPDWAGLSAALGELAGTGVDAAVRPWRLHVFRGISGVPGIEGDSALVAVLQMSHALADGRRGAAIARALFADPAALTDSAPRAHPAPASVADSVRDLGPLADFGLPGLSELLRRTTEFGGLACRSGSRLMAAAARRGPVDPALVDALVRIPVQLAKTALRGFDAYRAQQELAALTATGALPAPGPGFPPTMVNGVTAKGVSGHRIRMIVCSADRLRAPGRTVTVVVLTAVSVALTSYLEEHGERVDRLGAQVPMALPGNAIAAHNNYRSLGIDLHVGEPDLRARAARIAEALVQRGIRARHPLLAAQDRVTAVTPAPLLRRDVDHYPIDTVPESIAGHTVVSSVHRGPADLTFGGGRVRFTAGFPAIGSVMRLTHGVHGIGDTVTVSVHADAAALPDLDRYTELLRTALHGIGSALTP